MIDESPDRDGHINWQLVMVFTTAFTCTAWLLWHKAPPPPVYDERREGLVARQCFTAGQRQDVKECPQLLEGL